MSNDFKGCLLIGLAILAALVTVSMVQVGDVSALGAVAFWASVLTPAYLAYLLFSYLRRQTTALEKMAKDKGGPKCPYCMEPVNPGATVCKTCHRDLPPPISR